AEAALRHRLPGAIALPGILALRLLPERRWRPDLSLAVLASSKPGSEARAQEDVRGERPAAARAEHERIGVLVLLAVHEPHSADRSGPGVCRCVSRLARRLHRFPEQPGTRDDLRRHGDAQRR